MISDDRLREAAGKASDAILASLPDTEHDFPAHCDGKILRIGRKSRIKKALSTAAVVLLVIALGGIGVLTFSPSARAGLESSWSRLTGDDGWSTFINGNDADKEAKLLYLPTWLPDGYAKTSVDEDFATIVYMNGNDAITYTCDTQSTDFLSAVECRSHELAVGTAVGTVYVPVENELGYTKTTLVLEKGGCLITITADLSEQELVKIAESVKITDN